MEPERHQRHSMQPTMGQAAMRSPGLKSADAFADGDHRPGHLMADLDRRLHACQRMRMTDWDVDGAAEYSCRSVPQMPHHAT